MTRTSVDRALTSAKRPLPAKARSPCRRLAQGARHFAWTTDCASFTPTTGSVRLEARQATPIVDVARANAFRSGDGRAVDRRRRRSTKPITASRWTERDRGGPRRMIGLDTNVLLRLFVERRSAQSDRARRCSSTRRRRTSLLRQRRRARRIRLDAARAYKMEASAKSPRLIERVCPDDLDVRDPPRRGRARSTATAPARPTFADYFLAAINLELGCATTATFDQRRARFRLPCRSRLTAAAEISPMPPFPQFPPPDLAPPRPLRRDVRADEGRPAAARRHRARHRGREGFHHLRRGGEVRRRQGDPRRHGPGADDARARRRRHRHHQRRHPRSLGDREGRRRPEGRAHPCDRQGRQSRHPAGRHDHRRAGDGSDRRRGQDPDRRRLRHPHPFHLPAADRGGADVGRDLDAGRRHRPRDRHLRHHLHARPLAHSAHDRGGRRLSR